MTGTTPIDVIIQGDCLEEMGKLPDRSIDAIVTDPPAGINFMQKSWDGDKGGRNQWIAWMKDIAGECLRVIKPGGHAMVWALPRTSHWTGMAWEEAGWEPRDKISHVFGSGFPKSLDISKALDKMAGAEREVIGKRTRLGDSKPYPDKPNVFNSLGGDDLTAPATSAAKQWAGWGSSLKPAHEDWWLFRAPLDGCTIAENVLRWGCGGLNVDGCRIATNGEQPTGSGDRDSWRNMEGRADRQEHGKNTTPPTGRFPSNLIHDASPEVLAEFAKAGVTKSGAMKKEVPAYDGESTTGFLRGWSGPSNQHGDSGSVARFFMACEFTPADYAPIVYYAKASKSDRGEGNTHATVKPTSLIQYLARLSCPPGGTILDPFAGSGTLAIAAIKEGFHYILIEQQAEYCEIARKRIAAVPMRLDNWM